MNYALQFQQFNTQFLENIKNAEDTNVYDEINTNFNTQNKEITEMFIKQDESLKDLDPCLVSLERIHKLNSNLIEPIEQLTDEVIS